MKICIIGNSKRQKILAENLLKKQFEVNFFCDKEEIENTIYDDIVVLPIPTLDKNGFINLGGNNKITLDELLNKICKKSTVIACGAESKVREVIDLNKREDFTYLNAVPTAEGAIFYALNNSEISLYESKILITGFGHVAKLLADRLKGLCSDITVAARSLKDLSYAESLSFKTIKICELTENINKFNLIFQTVPTLIITPDIIDRMNSSNMIIELSSKSRGTDFEYAQIKGVPVIHAPALPEKISPKTAGNILTKSVLSIIDEYNRRIYSE